MMSKNDLEDFLRNVFWPMLKAANIKKYLLLVDQWSFRDNYLFDSIQRQFLEILVKRMLIPEGTTGLIQPLNVFYFRLYKLFICHITNYLEIDCEIWKRDNLQTFAHYQFQASKFSPLIQYAFYNAGYKCDCPESFTTPAQFCFDDDNLTTCVHDNCEKISLCTLLQMLLFQSLFTWRFAH